MGADVYEYLCGVLYSAQYDFCVPECDAGMWLWIPADDGWLCGAGGQTCCGGDRDERWQLCAGGVLSSGGMDGSSRVYGRVLCLGDEGY